MKQNLEDRMWNLEKNNLNKTQTTQINMEHDFEKLNTFETATIGMMAIGLVLIGTICFYCLPENGQVKFEKSVAFLDIHEGISKPFETIQLVLDTPKVYLDQFYLAFTETLALPIDTQAIAANIDSVSQDFGLIADYFGQVYAEQYAPTNRPGPVVQMAVGRVLGAVVDTNHVSQHQTQSVGTGQARNTYQASSVVLNEREESYTEPLIINNFQSIYNESVFKQYFSKLTNFSP